MRGVHLALAAFVMLAAGCSDGDGSRREPGGVDGARLEETSTSVVASPTAPALRLTPTPPAGVGSGTAFPALGELGIVAFIRSGDVWMKALPAGEETQITFDGGYYHPAWSPNGNWLAVQRSAKTVLLSRSRDSMEVPSADRANWAWSPTADQLAFVTVRAPSELHLVDPPSQSDRVIWRPETGLAGTRIAWSGDGTQIAVGMQPTPSSQPITKEQAGESGTGAALLVIDVATGTARELARATRVRGSFVPAAFSVDGRWIVAYESTDISASLAADGMPLVGIEVATGRVVDLGTHALLNDDAIASGPFPIAIVAGGGRQAWSHKRLWIAAFPTHAEPSAGVIPDVPDGVAASPAWGRTDGLVLAFVHGRELPDSTSSITAALIEMQRRIWVYHLASSTIAPAFHDAGIREEHPEWSADGRSLLFVRVSEDKASLWMGSPRGDPALMVDGLLPELSTGFHGFYGNVPWEQMYDWWQAGRLAWMPAVESRWEAWMESWDVWSTDGASQGLSFALGKMDAADSAWVHAPPESVRVEVRHADGTRRAFADGLRRQGERLPMCFLTIDGATVVRKDAWPSNADIGLPVILPGGEIGILRSWWNAPDHKEWRWTVEFYNSDR